MRIAPALRSRHGSPGPQSTFQHEGHGVSCGVVLAVHAIPILPLTLEDPIRFQKYMSHLRYALPSLLLAMWSCERRVKSREDGDRVVALEGRQRCSFL